MSKVYLKDVVTRIKDKVDKDNTDLEYYIGGEHFDNGEIQITKKGVIARSTIGPAFHMRFVPGDVLLMSRNPHLRKAGVVDFEGICSDVSYVCRTKDENVLMQKFLPFIFQSDDFWRFAEENKKGSTNFFLNWSDFEKYEFNLPPIETQKKLVEILWSFEDTKTAYKKLLDKTDELVKSQFIEHFGQLPEHFKHETIELGKIADIMSGGTPSSKHPEYYGGTIPFVSTPCLGKNYIDESDAQNWLTELGVEKSSTHIIPAYSVMFGSRVGVGKSSINTCEMCTNQDILSFFNIDNSRYDILFIKKVMDQYADYIETQKRGTTIKGVTSDVVKGIRIPIVSIEEQKLFAEFTEQSDKSKFELKQSIADIDNLTKALMQQELN